MWNGGGASHITNYNKAETCTCSHMSSLFYSVDPDSFASDGIKGFLDSIPYPSFLSDVLFNMRGCIVEDIDRMSRCVVPYPGLLCLQVSYIWDDKHKWESILMEE